MLRGSVSFLLCTFIALSMVTQPKIAEAQLTTNTVDFDITAIINCTVPENTEPAIEDLICRILYPCMLDQFVESERFMDELFVGYRNDMPAFFRNQLDEPVILVCEIIDIDGPGNVLAQASPGIDANMDGINDPGSILTLQPNPFLRRRGGFRAWAMTRIGLIQFDVDDMAFMILSDTLQEVTVHEAYHALGHPSLFAASDLNGVTNVFNQVNFNGDGNGINGVGFGLTEFRAESGNPFASFIPLSQNDGSAHLSAFEPSFRREAEGFQEAFIPTAPPPGVLGFTSRALQGMFADLGFLIKGVNSPGFLDLDGDGIEDDPLVINPTFDLDCDPTN